ncbi:MAG TPA: 2-oxoacid:acceptor oxidoreductase family protein [Firmicutes bacterium]|nr:2-oxoacid:acceptor oxidoreductase family protein [Bacillota bacterium]
MSGLKKIMLAGEGGQGVQSVAAILSEAAYAAGKEVMYIPNFGVEQRGGVSIAFMQISDEVIGSPKFDDADIIVALSDRAIERVQMYVNPNTVYVYDANISDAAKAKLPAESDVAKLQEIAAHHIANTELHVRVFNVIIMGAVLGLTNIVSVDDVKKALDHKFQAKFEANPSLRDMNYTALEKGISLVG